MPLRALVIDDDPERAGLVIAGLHEAGHEIAGLAGSRDDLGRFLRRSQADVVITSLPHPTRAMIERLAAATADMPRPIVMFVGEAGADLAGPAIRAGVSAYVVDGLAPRRVKAVLEVAVARFEEEQRLRNELQASRTALAERKLIDRAKGMLMRQRGMTEEEAYAMLRKAAMDQNRRVAEIAQSVLAVARMLDPGGP